MMPGDSYQLFGPTISLRSLLERDVEVVRSSDRVESGGGGQGFRITIEAIDSSIIAVLSIKEEEE